MADRTCTTVGCDKPVHRGDLCRPHYKKAYGAGWSQGDPERRKARYRAKTHKRRSGTRYGDVTVTHEQQLRTKAKRCPLCHVKLVDAPYLPASKELDHMVPLCVGGTHTIGNTRIICRDCNQARPKDGSDYMGPVTLWAQLPGFVSRPPKPVPKPLLKPKPEPACKCGEPLTPGRCWTCDPYRMPRYVPARSLTAQQQRERARMAAQMRSAGSSWWEIADTLGFGRESSAFLAASRSDAA